MTLGLTITTHQRDSGETKLSLASNPAHDSQDVHVVYPSEETNHRVTTAIVPPGSKWHAGAHWHEEYDEVMRVVKGRAKIRMGSTYKIVTPSDAEVLIPKFIVHDVMRADVNAKPGDRDKEELWLEEWSVPTDGSKELFFRHVFSIMADQKCFGWRMPLQLLLTLIHTDVYLHIAPGPVSWYVTHGIYAVLKPLASGLGLKPFYDEYTPETLQGIAEELEAGRLKTD